VAYVDKVNSLVLICLLFSHFCIQNATSRTAESMLLFDLSCTKVHIVGWWTEVCYILS